MSSLGSATRKAAAVLGERRSSKTPTEGIHERSARLQREKGLPREAQPSERLVAVGRDETHQINIAARTDANYLNRVFGERQLGATISQFTSREKIDEAAESVGLHRNGNESNAKLISRIVSHVTEGRYSADFGKASAAGKASKGAKTPTPRETVSRAEHERVRSQLEQARAEIARLKAENATLKAGQGQKASKAPKAPQPLTQRERVEPISREEERRWSGGEKPSPNAAVNPWHISRQYGRAALERHLNNYDMQSLRKAAPLIEAHLRSQGHSVSIRGRSRAAVVKNMLDAVDAYPQEPFNLTASK